MKHTLCLTALLLAGCTDLWAQDFIQDNNNFTQYGQQAGNRNFNKLRNDSTQDKEIPIGLHVWNIDRKFGDITAAEIDTMPHLYPNTTFNTGVYGEYNTTGNNYTARESRIVIDRPLTQQFIFTQPYSYFIKEVEQLHFTNTLSPITNISYDNCGDKTNGEDHIDARFAVNANKKTGMGFDLNYAYARGYYSNQSASHFGATLYLSHIGDRYQLHTVFSTNHQKVAENGGITNDNYITHPESFSDTYAENEIPTILQRNWNRNNNIHFFLNHRYAVGFYRQVKMTDEEIKARQFAQASKKDNEDNDKEDNDKGDSERKKKQKKTSAASGRPEGARIAGDAPAGGGTAVTDSIRMKIASDSTRVKIANDEELKAKLQEEALQDSIDATMKREYVPVTSFIHTLDVNKYDRIYQAYKSPEDYYANRYYECLDDYRYGGDSIYDQTKMLSVKNTFAIALLEGFNKYAKAGVKVFATHELRKFTMPQLLVTQGLNMATAGHWNENTVSIGGQLNKTQGNTLHYNLMVETWLTGEDAGQLKADFSTDLNFPLFGDTVTLAAKAYIYRLNPTFYQRQYHSKNFWWDNGASDKETRTRIEGLFHYRKTKTSLRVAIEEIQNYTYFAMNYTATDEARKALSAGIRQCGSNINLLTAQLQQNVKLGPLHWENIITYQNSSDKDVLPVPALNVFTNLYLKFRIAHELSVELGADAWMFTEYDAPDFCPQLNQFAVQENKESRQELGGYPFVDAYVNMHLKHTRFFIMFSHANAGNGNKMYFLAPHYPQNGRVLRMGVSWNFFN